MSVADWLLLLFSFGTLLALTTFQNRQASSKLPVSECATQFRNVKSRLMFQNYKPSKHTLSLLFSLLTALKYPSFGMFSNTRTRENKTVLGRGLKALSPYDRL